MPHAPRMRMAVAGLAAGVVVAAAAPAQATRPATQAEINGIVSAVNTYTTARGYTDSRYIVNKIQISSESQSPLYASAKVTPRPKYRKTTPAPELLLTRPIAAGAPWQVLDAGARFCTDTRVPAAVILDLFGQRCATGGGSGTGSTVTLASRRVGPLRAVLSATRGPQVGRSVPASVYLTLFRNGVEIGQPQIGTANGFVWSQVRRGGAGYVSINPSVGYVGAQVLQNPTALYLSTQFKVLSSGRWWQVRSAATG